eukprot:1747446-Amphidinium_carterae.1
MKKQLAILEKKLADQRGQKPNKGTGKSANRGGGKGAQTSDPHGLHSTESPKWRPRSPKSVRPAHRRTRRPKPNHSCQPGRACWRCDSCSTLYRRRTHARRQRRAAKARSAAWRAGCRRSYGGRPQTHSHHVRTSRRYARECRRYLQREQLRNHSAAQKGQNSDRLAGVTASQAASQACTQGAKGLSDYVENRETARALKILVVFGFVLLIGSGVRTFFHGVHSVEQTFLDTKQARWVSERPPLHATSAWCTKWNSNNTGHLSSTYKSYSDWPGSGL